VYCALASSEIYKPTIPDVILPNILKWNFSIFVPNWYKAVTASFDGVENVIFYICPINCAIIANEDYIAVLLYSENGNCIFIFSGQLIVGAEKLESLLEGLF